jgi:large subunit ribosomal protein L19
MVSNVIAEIDKASEKAEAPAFRVGDTVSVHVRILEGDKERVQVFTGTVIGRRGGGARETYTVRRISHGVGVERVFPVHSPFVERVVVESSATVRRAKLYYLRRRVGKQTRLREKQRTTADA